MSTLSDMPLWALAVLVVGGLAAIAAVGRWFARRVFAGDGVSASALAPPLMPALGTAFAVLAAFAVANAASGLRDAELDVVQESSAAARLAWSLAGDGAASTAHPVLQAYLDATIADEWADIDELSPGQGAAVEELTDLERTVRSIAASDELGSAQQAELLVALDGVSSARRGRFAAAEPISSGVVVLLTLSAIALVVNAAVLTLDTRRRVAAMLVGLVAVTGLSIAFTITLGAPFSGSFRVSADPLVDVADDLRNGTFTLEL
jgi:hypothetical protein